MRLNARVRVELHVLLLDRQRLHELRVLLLDRQRLHIHRLCNKTMQ
eukprot:COSAG01_NODE_41102_length_455_cov_14.702166_1_plen_45_part_01